MTLVLSGTSRVVLSGTQGSSYQEPKSPSNPHKCWRSGPLNISNTESFGFLLTLCAAAGAWGCRHGYTDYSARFGTVGQRLSRHRRVVQ
jgi:hypothetical protein